MDVDWVLSTTAEIVDLLYAKRAIDIACSNGDCLIEVWNVSFVNLNVLTKYVTKFTIVGIVQKQ